MFLSTWGSLLSPTCNPAFALLQILFPIIFTRELFRIHTPPWLPSMMQLSRNSASLWPVHRTPHLLLLVIQFRSNMPRASSTTTHPKLLLMISSLSRKCPPDRPPQITAACAQFWIEQPRTVGRESAHTMTPYPEMLVILHPSTIPSPISMLNPPLCDASSTCPTVCLQSDASAGCRDWSLQAMCKMSSPETTQPFALNMKQC
mmetsp:Transcript_41586/g.85023  ORF Transcript_41586/g.85023 Transcript_41586/m.85023 type:complete len:203 (-) Transcript_41586:261-869(-)